MKDKKDGIKAKTEKKMKLGDEENKEEMNPGDEENKKEETKYNKERKKERENDIYFYKDDVLALKIANTKSGDYPYTLFIGAGASVSSGIPTAKQMIKNWQEELFRILDKSRKDTDPVDFEKWLKKEKDGYKEWLNNHKKYDESEYSTLFNYIYQFPKERQNYIEQLVEEKKPTFGYMYLAGLIAEKKFNRILTTNFDDLISDALVRFYDIKPIVCAFDSIVSSIRVASHRPKIIKLHGDFLYDNIKNIRDELKSLDSNMEDKLYEMCKDSGLIVVGYGGEDESIMAPLRDMIRKPGYLNMGLHWCIHKASAGDIPRKVKEIRNYYEKKVYFYEMQSFDRLMEKIFTQSECKLPPVLLEPHSKSAASELWESYRNSSTDYPSSKMIEDINLFFERSLNKDDDDLKKKFELADVKNEKANRKLKEKNLFEARMDYEEGYKLISEVIERIKPSDTSFLINALKRKAGLCLGLVDIDISEKKENFKSNLYEAIDVSNKAIEEIKKYKVKDFSVSKTCTLYYNACFAYAYKAEWDKENFSTEDEARLREYFKQFKFYDTAGIEIISMQEEPEYQYLKLLKQLVENE